MKVLAVDAKFFFRNRPIPTINPVVYSIKRSVFRLIPYLPVDSLLSIIFF